MKRLKALGLAAVAATALTAFLGAGSASATVLCTTTTNPCNTGWHIDEIHAVATTSLSLHSTGGALEATCTGGTWTAKKSVTGSSTETATGTVATAGTTWSGCNQTTETLEGGSLEVHQIAGTDNGTVTARGFRVTTVIGGINCIYGAGAGIDLGVLTGGHDPIIHVNAVVEKQPGSAFICPQTSVWEGTYTITNHTNVYVVNASSATVLCTKTASPCGAESQVGEMHAVATSSLSLHSTGGALEATCTGGTVTAKKAAGSAAVYTVAAAEMTWSGCNQTTDTLEGGELEIHQISGTDNGTVTARGFRVTVVIAGVSCIDGAGTGIDIGVITGGHDPILHVNAIVEKQGGSFLCPKTSVWEGTYTFTNHTEAYVIAE